jgi:DNA-binding CsgD family transcriptional regulator
MDGVEGRTLQSLLDTFTRVITPGEARQRVLETFTESTNSSGHLVELEPLNRGIIRDIRHGHLITERFGSDLDRLLWSNPILHHLPRLHDHRVFRQSETVGRQLWYGSMYYNDFFRVHDCDDSIVMMLARSGYALATVREHGHDYLPDTFQFVAYLQPLIERGLLRLNDWQDRWFFSDALEALSENSSECIVALRNGALLSATAPARAVLGLDQHGAATNIWLADLVAQSAEALRRMEGLSFAGSDGASYRLSAIDAPGVDKVGVRLVKLHRMQPAKSTEQHYAIGRKLGLTQREAEVLAMAIRGMSAQNIADSLKIATHTVRAHLQKAYRRLDVNNRVEAFNKLEQAKS